MRKIYLATFEDKEDGPVILDSTDIYDVATGKTLEVIINEFEIMKEAFFLFLKGPIQDNGNIERLSEIRAKIEANEKKIAALNKAQLPPEGYEIAEGIKVAPVTIVRNGIKAPEGAEFVLQLEEIEIDSSKNL